MIDLNKATIIGRLTHDPKTFTASSGSALSSFSIATNRQWKDEKSGERKTATEFHNITAFGKLAEIIGKYLKKGAKVYVDGHLRTRRYNGKDGTPKTRTEIVAENMIMLGRSEQQSGAPDAFIAGDAALEQVPVRTIDGDDA